MKPGLCVLKSAWIPKIIGGYQKCYNWTLFESDLDVANLQWLNYSYSVWVPVVCNQTAKAPEIASDFPPHTCSTTSSDFQAVVASALRQLWGIPETCMHIILSFKTKKFNVFWICIGFIPRAWHSGVLKAQLFSGSLVIWERGRVCRRLWSVSPTLLLDDKSNSLSSLRDGATWTEKASSKENTNKFT